MPTHRRLRYRGRRKARYRGGWVALHRTSFAPVGRRTKFHDVTASSLPFDQPCLVAPCNNALSRRGQHLNLTLRRIPKRIALHLFIDSTGLSMVGAGEWAAAKHGRRGRRGWKKLHLGVDQAGVIVAQALTDSAVDDASTGIDLIETIASSARTVTADAAYDTLAFYETANTRGTTVVVPPAKTARCFRHQVLVKRA